MNEKERYKRWDKKERLERWDKYKKDEDKYGKDENYLHLKNDIYSGPAGIYMGETETETEIETETKIAISLYSKKGIYEDVINDQGLLEYQYPNTNRSSSHDKNEIDSVKECKKLDMPLFIVLPLEKQIKLGKVSSFCDNKKFFTIEFIK